MAIEGRPSPEPPREGAISHLRAGAGPHLNVPANIPAGASPPGGVRGWLGRSGPEARPFAWMIGALAVAMAEFWVAPILNCLRATVFNKDYTLWYRVGRDVLKGAEVYPTDHRPFPFMYPPPCASMLAMASTLGELPFIALLLAINSVAWVAAILLAVSLATGKALRQHPLVYLVPMVAMSAYVHDTYLLGQPNLLLLALMLGAFACLRAKRPAIAGGLIALAAAIKAFPILALGYLIYRKQWKATASTLGLLLALMLLLPIPFRGQAQAWGDLTTWTRGMVLKYDSGGIAQRADRSYSFKNQSMMALANRMLRAIPADAEAKESWTVHVADLDFRTVNAVIAATALGLCLFYVSAMPRASGRTPRTDAIEWAMLLLMILFFSPLSFVYFYVWLLYPLALATHLALSAPAGSRGRAVRVGWVAATLAILATAIPLPRLSHAYGNEFFAGLILFVGLGLELRRARADVVPVGLTASGDSG